MRKLLKFLLILSTPFLSINISAEEPTPTGQVQPINRDLTGNRPSRPHAPSNARIYFMYDAAQGECHFDLLPEIEYISVTLEHLQTHAEYYGDVDATNPILYMQLEPGIYHITCVTDDGSIYAGNISI